ncbi:zinc finger protein 277 [Anabrus simplex]|uniref:zinc finger protein 277 n=1 Tax=Anabrus simplex TaxID=316456 RepID=UPI0034DCE0E7
MAEAPEIPESVRSSPSTGLDFVGHHLTQCLMCTEEFLLPMKKQDLISHLFIEHKIIIGRIEEIANIKGYIDYWRIRFQAGPITRFCTEFITEVDMGQGGSRQESIYFLCDVLHEDKLLREGLHLKRLEWILQQQEGERKQNISRHCLLCGLDFTGLRTDYFSHLINKHHLKLGSPENLVFTDELLDVIDEKLSREECLFCGRIFKSHHVLKEHMRKKQHKRINPNNKAFDKYFIVNYLEIGKNWEQIQGEKDDSDSAEESSSWSDWEDDGETPPIVCLYCDYASLRFECVLDHMKSEHGFDYDKISRHPPLPFYEQVKLVNYIRQQVSHCLCPNCNEKFQGKDALAEHMSNTGHFELPDKKLWEHNRYFFPEFDNDTFLCHLYDFEDPGED